MKALFLVLIGLSHVASYTQTLDPNGTIATVNGEKIVASEYYTRMAYLDDVGTINNGKFVEVPPAYLTLQRMINERIVLQLAREKGVLPSAAEASAELTRKKTENPDRYQRMRDLGVADAALLNEALVDLAQYRLMTQGITITDEQVTNHYNLNKMVYRKPATVKLRVIVVKAAADKVKVDDALKTKSFADVAKTFSVDLTKFDGGDLPVVPIVNLPQNLLNEVMRSSSGQATNWIESEGAFLKYLVESKTDEQQVPLDEKLKAEIRRRMMLVAGQQKNGDAIQTAILAKRKAAAVTISAPGLQKLWNLYVSGG